MHIVIFRTFEKCRQTLQIQYRLNKVETFHPPLFHTKIETVAQLSLEVVLVCCTPGFVSVLIDDILKTMKSECAMEIRFLGKHTPWQGIIRSKSQSATVCASRFMALE